MMTELNNVDEALEEARRQKNDHPLFDFGDEDEAWEDDE